MSNSFYYFLLIFLLFSFASHNLAQNNGRVATSSSISATDESTPWLSPSGDFAFGFKKIQENKNVFLLCIWYAKIQENTIVWHANISDLVPQGSRLNLDPQRGLTLSDPQGNTLWRNDLVFGNIDYGLMNDDGNFVVMGSDSNDPLWESFRNPTDTLLPNQTLERGSFLVSQKSKTSFTQGRFYLRMLDNGNLVLVTQSVPSNMDYDDEYYNTQTSDTTNATNSGDKLVFEENGVMYVLKRNNETQTLTPRSIPSASDNYHRVTLNFDGVLSHYYHSRMSNNSGWNVLWSQPDNICIEIDGGRGPGSCGYNNVCNLGTNNRPVCNCPKGYSLVDPNDAYGDCKPDFSISCDDVGRDSPEDFYSFITIRDTDWPKSDFQQISPSTEQDCQSACLNDCFCAVAIYRSNSCWKKKLPLSNGRIDTNLNSKAFMKIRKDGVPWPPPSPGLSIPESHQKKNWRIWATDESTPWLSPSGDFAFGFKKIQENKTEFLLCIWYAKIQENTIVWHANISDLVPQGSRLNLDPQRGLTLSDPQGNTLWRNDLVFGNIDYGLMNDDGNFVVMGSDSNDPLWESFRNPTDTLLPNQTLERGSFLVSQKSQTSFTRGRFYLRMLDNGNLVLVTQSVPSNMDYDDEYYNTQTSDTTNATNSGDKLVFEENGVMYVLKRNNETQTLTPRSIPSASDNYHRVTLNFDGVLSHYYHSRMSNNSGWNVLWSQPDNICIEIDGGRGPGSCGYNNVCNLGTNNRPVCNCPKGYSLVDPNDAYGDCKPDFSISCDDVGRDSPEDFYSFITIRDTDWPKSDFQQISPSTEQDCQSACLNDCFCAVAIYRSNSCWKKKLPLSNGRIDTNLNSKTFMKIRKDGVPWPPPSPGLSIPESHQKKNWRIWAILASSFLGSSVLVNVLFIGVFCWGFFHIYKKKVNTFRPTSHVTDSVCHSFTYKELVEATNEFKEELGRGAFGIVYKGVMSIGSRNVVAIKKLDRVAHEAEKEFMTEVNVISQTHHKNFVRLLGYCNEGAHRLLVYEYMSNGTLASFIFGDLKPTWSQRTNIAMGIARGLAYLHEECSTQIIHCDIKPQNILLDDYHIARISDFGLSKLLMINQSRTDTNIRGTRGYVAPEWFRNSPVTVKVDVYSFGVLLLEIITCRKCLKNEESYGLEAILVDWVLDCFQEGKLEALVRSDIEALNDKKQLERFVMVGIWCIQEDPSMRPTMRKVCQMLEGSVEVTIPPCPYNFSITT